MRWELRAEPMRFGETGDEGHTDISSSEGGRDPLQSHPREHERHSRVDM